MVAPTAGAKLAPTALFWGEEDYHLRLAAMELFRERDVRATEVDAAEWQGGESSDLATPSLWGERRALLVTNCQRLPEAGARELKAYLETPSPEALCILTQVSRAKNPPPLAKLVQAGGGLVRHVAVKRQDLSRWVLERARARNLHLTPAASAALIGALGEDPAVLDQGVEQLSSAFSGRPVGPDEVRSQFRGLGEQQVWDLCDRALSGRLPEALVSLRSLLEGRGDPLLILGGIASRVRDLIRVRSLSDRVAGDQVARAAGLRFDWQAKRYREQARRFSSEQLVALHDAVVGTDRALKGGWPAEVLLAALVSAMAGQEDAGLDLPVRVSR
jgi:DNA polymerase-3 subunit delta